MPDDHKFGSQDHRRHLAVLLDRHPPVGHLLQAGLPPVGPGHPLLHRALAARDLREGLLPGGQLDPVLLVASVRHLALLRRHLDQSVEKEHTGRDERHQCRCGYAEIKTEGKYGCTLNSVYQANQKKVLMHQDY
ncbi:hypothetical protein CDAR_230961 [Caerostris darwini]|uniref:Uncharacterized protein n=1 Tax=Caerostris darwini TaxID=1538125 RepID=A0AAV4S3Z1_9ARAC|nr:hypothetical protein CDAR_230961 [Caerostris darwini]